MHAVYTVLIYQFLQSSTKCILRHVLIHSLPSGQGRHDRREGGLGAENLQGGPVPADQSTQAGEVRGHVQHDLPQ